MGKNLQCHNSASSSSSTGMEWNCIKREKIFLQLCMFQKHKVWIHFVRNESVFAFAFCIITRNSYSWIVNTPSFTFDTLLGFCVSSILSILLYFFSLEKLTQKKFLLIICMWNSRSLYDDYQKYLIFFPEILTSGVCLVSFQWYAVYVPSW